MIDFGSLLTAGDGVWWGQGGAEPEPLVDALLDQLGGIGPIRAFSGLTWNPRLADPPPELTVLSYGGLGQLRTLAESGRLQVVPCHYSALPRLFARGALPCDLGIVQVSSPDGDGNVSLGIGVEYVADAIPHTRALVAEVNQQMPATEGAPRIPLSAFAAVVHTDRPLREAAARPADDVEQTIARLVAEQIEDGDTLQLGVGSLPNAVLAALADHSDLGVHSGLVTDGVLDLVERGVVTGTRKEVDPGLVVTGAALGTRTLYTRLADHPVRFRPASYTHDPAVLSQLRSLVAVNSAIEVDLLGQVGAEVRRGVHVGAVGGQVDFSRAASLTGGRSVIALRSESGGRSTIRHRLDAPVVSTGRVDVDVLVTEHGVARLTGCTERERARRLLAVAAPHHRDDLARSLAGHR